ncbi:hypothetical protein KDN24_08140 [Bacillus sp. Bva_UNVM-123]|uniref:hypothetical protein n=1 Tax=Bacillus sp. Bva_UNVM-123 TaxID=2829798 RepID=UPI00391F46DB
MEWTLAILLSTAVVLLILSFIKTKQTSSILEKQIDQTSFSIMNEVHQLQKQIRNIELDAEISAHEAGILSRTDEQRILVRDILDLHRRGYAIQSIAEKKELTVNEVESLLAPYMTTKGERSKLAQ